MAKVVGKTRVLIGKAKKSQNSKTFIDPEQSELGSALILQKKRQAAKLEKGKEKQTHVNSEMDAKVMEYFRKNPAKDIETADNPLTLYENMRQQMHVIDNDALFVENSNNDYFWVLCNRQNSHCLTTFFVQRSSLAINVVNNGISLAFFPGERSYVQCPSITLANKQGWTLELSYPSLTPTAWALPRHTEVLAITAVVSFTHHTGPPMLTDAMQIWLPPPWKTYFIVVVY